MNKYELRTNNKKNSILKATLELIQKSGFVNTNIKEIADLAKVSQVSIYNYFGSKNLLVKESIAFFMDDILLKAEELLTHNIPFEQKVRQALSLCSEEIGRSMGEFFSVTALEDPQMTQAIVNAISDKKTLLYAKYIEAGKSGGYIDSSIPTSTILDYINAFGTLGNSPKYHEQDVKYRDDLLKLLLNGILTK